MTDTTTTPSVDGQAPTENTNCLAGLRCPQCGQADRLLIVARIMADVTDDGADLAKGSDMDWDDDSFTVCPECDRDGTLAEFRVKAEAA